MLINDVVVFAILNNSRNKKVKPFGRSRMLEVKLQEKEKQNEWMHVVPCERSKRRDYNQHILFYHILLSYVFGPLVHWFAGKLVVQVFKFYVNWMQWK